MIVAKIDEKQKADFLKWKEKLEKEAAEISGRIEQLNETARLLRTRRNLLELAAFKYGESKAGVRFKEDNIVEISKLINEVESEYNGLEEEASIRLGQINVIIREIEEWLIR
jgi:hypothetical protein